MQAPRISLDPADTGREERFKRASMIFFRLTATTSLSLPFSMTVRLGGRGTESLAEIERPGCHLDRDGGR